MWLLTHREKRMSHTARVLRLLKKKNKWGCLNYELASPEVGGLNWRARISELRHEGHDIRCYRVAGGGRVYHLIETLDD